MINKLMRMEERIVLDGSVAAAVAIVANAPADANDASEDGDSFDPTESTPLDQQVDDLDQDGGSGDENSPNSDPNPGGSDLTAEGSDFLADILSLGGDFTPELRAIIINTDLADSSDLLDAIADDIVVITYSGEQDNLQDILADLDQASNGLYFDSIALAAHSNGGGELFLLDSEHVSADSLREVGSEQAEFFDTLGNYLNNNGRIDLLSCYSGLGVSGENLINAIKGISGRDVAASTDLTGNASVGGDWILENGNIDAMALYFESEKLSSYDATLQAPNQTLDGDILVNADIQLGLEMDYYDFDNNSTDETGNGVLAVTGFDADSNSRYIRVYREDSTENEYSLETTIWGNANDTSFGNSIAVGHDGNGEVLVVSSDDSVYLFEQNTSGQSDYDWSDIDSVSDATTSKAFAHVDSVDIIGTTVAVGDTANNSGAGIIDIYLKNSGWDFGVTPDSSISITGISGASGFGLGALLVDVEAGDSYADGYNTADQVFGYLNSADTISESGLFYATVGEWLGDASLNVGLSHQIFEGSEFTTFRDLDVSIHSAGVGGTWSTALSNGYDLAESVVLSYTDTNDGLNFVDCLAFATQNDGELYDANGVANTVPPITISSFEAPSAITTIATGLGMIAFGEPNTADANSIGVVYTCWWDSNANSGDGEWIQSTQPTNLNPLNIPLTAATQGNNDNFGTSLVFTSESGLLIGAPSIGADEGLQGIYTAPLQDDGFGAYWGWCDEVDYGVYEDYAYADKVILAKGTDYIGGFGSHMTEDHGLMVVTSDDVTDGFLIYSYQDTDSDGTTDSWVYSRTLSISDYTELGEAFSIFSIAMEGTTFAISIDGSTRDLVYVFNDITGSSRENGNYESEILSTNEANITFGDDIDVVDGAIFVTIRSTDISGSSNINIFWDNAGQYGSDNGQITDTKYRILDENFIYNSSCNAEIMIDADKRSSGTEAYSLVATSSIDDQVLVWSWENGTNNMTTNKEALYFNPFAFGGTSNANILINNVAVEEDIIIASAPSFSIQSQANLGAIAVFRGIDGVWTNGTTTDGNATLAAVLTAHPTVNFAGSIGQTDIDISDDGGEVFATSSRIGINAILAWSIEDLSPSIYTSMMINDRVYIENDPSATIGSIQHSSTEQLLASYPSADKSDSNTSNKGIVDSFNEDYYIPDIDIEVTPTYTPGDPDSGIVDDGGFPIDDLGDVVFNFSDAVYISYFSDNMEIAITHTNESNEATVDLTITNDQANALLSDGNTKLTLDLNDPMFYDLELGVTYTIFVPAGMFKNSLGQVNSEPYIYTFTATEEGVVITTENTPTNPSEGDEGGDNNGGEDGGDGEDSGGLEGFENEISDLLASIFGDGEGEGNGTDEGTGEDTGEGNGNGDGNEEGEAEGNVGTNNNNGAGPTNSMMVQNPFSDLITSDQVSTLFNSTVAAFASVGMDNPAIFAMMQDAMGDTMTTAALVRSCESLLSAADDLLAMFNEELDNGELSLSGGGHTAEIESLATIVENASAEMVQSRGNALIANDLLRILTINIKGFDDRIAETSFAGGVKRLATSNEEFAYSYEVLNSILKIVKESKASGKIITASELNALLPEIKAAALEKSTGLSENGDRASRDVLSFLTRQMQQKGVDKENLQAQVSTVFEQWHENLGLSTPVTATNTDIANIAYSETIPAQAM